MATSSAKDRKDPQVKAKKPSRMSSDPKEPVIIFLDIENTPLQGYSWEIWDTNIIEVSKPWHLLSFCVQEFGKRPKTYCLPDFNRYEKDKESDLALTTQLWKHINEADVIIAHNGDKFDLRKANARFLFHGMAPPSPYKTVDTLKIARKHFKFTSNRLDDLAQYLGIGRKLPHQGKHTWFGCMHGDPKAWKTMRQYNQHDVWLLEQVYLRLRPWATSHVNLDNFTKKDACPNCQSTNTQQRGWSFTKTGKRKRMQCTSCGAWSQGKEHIRDKVH